MKTDEIRDRFLAYFKKKGHTLVRSDSLVPQNDPTLLFTGAGMNQFKDYFLGLKHDLKRAASSQKCLRTGDLDEVGRTPFHHSFFEMLGNFSFGDYFKREAILWAWEFLTEQMGLEAGRLHISVHQSDREAYEIWREEVKIPGQRITKLGDKTNFWPANAPADGPNGPCGPCSEIYYDQGAGPGRAHPCSVEHDCGRFAEIWNLVFTQFDRKNGGELLPLKNKNIDTGMGLERLACVVQGKKTNFEIDLFVPIVKEIKSILRWSGGADQMTRVYAIADHLRAVAFVIADGVIPSNEGRGYVARKLIRRAVWHAHELSGRKQIGRPVLFSGMCHVIESMKQAYPDLLPAQKNIEDTVRGEEERFLRTLEKGLALLNEKIKTAKRSGKNSLSGEEVFALYDTYGFPDELTRRIATEQGVEIAQKGFNRLMEEQKTRAKEASAISTAIFASTDFEQRLHGLSQTKFVGYENCEVKGKILLSQMEGNRGIVVLDQTPFYAESGGQVGDQGYLKAKGFEARVEDTQKKDRYILHRIGLLKGKIKVGMKVTAMIDEKRRSAAMRNHTATHLLHAVLREILGPHVRQLGSLVAPDRLRFDYSFSRPLTEDELLRIETRTNEEILKNTPVHKEVKDYETAKKVGALAFFGEKYGSRVRIVSVPGISKEFCGGTHCDRTGQIGAFIIVNESSVASGVRRIEALTGEGALEYLRQLRSQIQEVSRKLRTTPQEAAERVEKLQERLKKIEKEGPQTSGTTFDSKSLLEKAEQIEKYRIIFEECEGAERRDLRHLSDSLRSFTKRTVWLLYTRTAEKTLYVIGLSGDLKESNLDSREIAQNLSALVSGNGGGRKELSEGGATDPEAFTRSKTEILNQLKAYLSGKD